MKLWLSLAKNFFVSSGCYTRVMPSRATIAVAAITAAVVLASGVTAYFNRYALSDWYYLRTYTPSAEVATLADQSTMTTTGRDLFYRANPDIVTTRAAMVSHCHIASNQVAELGCYLSSDHIYLLQISNRALKDEMATTAGYEMLHSAYQRLSSGQRRQLDAELEQVAAHLTDPHIVSQLQIYAQTEPGARDDELYSALGTEYPDLTPALEANYQRYFTNRRQLVAYYQQFNQTFDNLHAQISQLDSQIESQKTIMHRYLEIGDINLYNGLVPSINSQIATYNADVELYNQYGRDILGTESVTSSQ